MRMTRRLGSIVAATALVAGAGLAVAPTASASPAPSGTKSLAEVLLADGDTFDSNWWDFDIVTQAALAVIGAKPSSDVALLTDGSVPLTAFIPNDRAFQRLVKDAFGADLTSEQAVFDAVAGLGIPTVEAVLLYHVVPGATIDSSIAVNADGAKLNTALPGASFRVDVMQKSGGRIGIALLDNDKDSSNPHLVMKKLDINKGNKQIAHGIGQVLRPINL